MKDDIPRDRFVIIKEDLQRMIITEVYVPSVTGPPIAMDAIIQEGKVK